MKRICLIILLLICAAPPAFAAGGKCAPYTKAITLDFQTLTPAPLYNNRLNVLGIRNLFREHSDAVTGPHERALGITYAQTLFSLEGATAVERVRGGYCIYLERVTASFGWKRMDVYVAAEFQPGTCEYRAVLDHENQHVGINNGALKDYAPVFRGSLETVLEQSAPVFNTDPQAGTNAALADVQQRMDGYLERFQKLQAARNAPLDSASNYGETAKLCTNWDGVSAPQRR